MTKKGTTTMETQHLRFDVVGGNLLIQAKTPGNTLLHFSREVQIPSDYNGTLYIDNAPNYKDDYRRFVTHTIKRGKLVTNTPTPSYPEPDHPVRLLADSWLKEARKKCQKEKDARKKELQTQKEPVTQT